MPPKKGNPLSLKAKEVKGNTPRAPRPKMVFTDEQKASMLEGYIRVPEAMWPRIKYGSHVRYIKKNGDFMPGGFVLYNPFMVGGVNPEPAMKLQNKPKKDSKWSSWTVRHSTLQTVFIRAPIELQIMQHQIDWVIDKMNENFRRIREYLDQMNN